MKKYWSAGDDFAGQLSKPARAAAVQTCGRLSDPGGAWLSERFLTVAALQASGMLADGADPVETFVERGRLELAGQHQHSFLRDDSRPLRVAGHADIQGNIEEESHYLTTAASANLDIRAALFRGEIGGVDISDGAPRGYPLPQ
jgi:hypothetical protein